MKSKFFGLFILINLVLFIFLVLNYRELIEWRDAPRAIANGSPDAYYYISRLQIRFGILFGLCFGVSISVIVFYLINKKENSEKNYFNSFCIFSVVALLFGEFFIIKDFL